MFDNDLRKALPLPMKNALDEFERRTLPTALELKTGRPGELKALTTESQALAGFCRTMKAAIVDVGTVHFKAHADSTLTEGSKLVRAATYANEKIKTARDTFESLYKRAEPALESYHDKFKEVLKPSSNVGEAMIESELRAWVKSHKTDKVLEAATSKDSVMAAVSKAPALLSGLSESNHARIRDEYLQKTVPNEFEKFSDIMTAISSAEEALRSLEKEAATLIDFESAAKIESRKLTA